MHDALSEARMRARRFSFRDGIEEITLGVIIMLSFGGNSIIHSGYLPGIVIYELVILSLVVYGRRIIDAVRARITYPRSGYVQSFIPRSRILASFVLGSLGGLVLVRVVRHVCRVDGANLAEWSQWVPALAGLGFGAAWIYVGMRYGLRRFLVVGVFSMFLGVGASIEFPWILALSIVAVGFGCANLCSGGFALLSYLRTTPPVGNGT
jgi:hypothetical protein